MKGHSAPPRAVDDDVNDELNCGYVRFSPVNMYFITSSSGSNSTSSGGDNSGSGSNKLVTHGITTVEEQNSCKRRK